jgi:glucosyl-dolichyl phosphate glucuronosyltransferase
VVLKKGVVASTMRISVILCTHNRCQSLVKALESIAASKLPQSVEWEVLVVDNNSHDQTREVVGEFCRRYPDRFRYLFEARPGKTFALNSGIRESRGEILVFTDDDVTVDQDWLQRLTSNLNNEKWAGAGGRTLPERGFVPPPWLPTNMRHGLAPLAIFDFGPEVRELVEGPYGNNMAFRRSLFQKYGGFRTDLGPCSGSQNPQKSEDSEFGTRVLAGGERLCYEASAIVYHSVPQTRVQKQYFLRWWYDKSRSDILAFGKPKDARWHVLGVPLYLLRRLAVWVVRWMLAFGERRRFECRLNVWSLAGQILECRRQSDDRGRVGSNG